MSIPLAQSPGKTRSGSPPRRRAGSVLIIVLWIALGLVSVAVLFAHSMSMELRSADNQVARLEAEEAIAGAVRYASNVLVNLEVPGYLPDPLRYRTEAVPVGQATFWFLGRDPRPSIQRLPYYSLVDEASKLNLNTATQEMLEQLPRMTTELAAAIMDWRDEDEEVTTNGAESEVYERLNPPYRCKNSKFESIDELRLVYGMDTEFLSGEDTNLNGILDPNENDADVSYPPDNRDGRLDPGLLDFITVYSREPNTRTNGESRINVASTNQQALASLLQEKFDTTRANEILQKVSGTAQAQCGSVLEFYLRSGMTPSEFAQVTEDLTTSTNSMLEGLVNANTAPEEVLTCIPGIGADLAPALVSYRQSNPAQTNSLAWVVEVLGETNAIAAGPYLTIRSYQFTADVAALGHHGRGYERAKYVFDTSEGTPRVIYRQQLTHLGWALGTEVRQQLQLLAQQSPSARQSILTRQLR